MKKLVAIILILASGSLIAQDLNSPKSGVEVNRFTLGLYFSPDVADRLLKSTDGNQATEVLIDSRNPTELAKFGYTTGVSIAYHITDHFSIESGIEHSNKGFKTKKQKLTFGEIIDPNRRPGFGDPDLSASTEVRTIYNYDYIGIPIKLNYTAGKGKLKFISSIGFTAEYLLNASSTRVMYTENEDPDCTTEKSDFHYRTFSLSPSISAGVDYQLNPRMSLRAMPSVRAGVISIIDAPITAYLYNFGFQMGWYMRFG